MNIIFSILGIILNFLPLFIAVIILIATHSFSYWSCLLLCLILNSINEAIKMQTKSGILLKIPLETQRTIIESNILNGTASAGQRIFYFLFTIFSTLVFGWHFTISIAIYSGIVTLIYNFIH